MKRFLPICMALCMLTFFTSATLKKGDKKKDKVENVKIYAFGFAASFVDTLAFYTEIQPLEGAKLVEKRFLDQRYMYSYQLKDYLDNHNKPNYVCMVFFSENKKKLYKNFDKIMAKYVKSGIALREISANEFKFEKLEEPEE